MFSNLQIRPAKPHRRKTSLTVRTGVTKRRISNVNAQTANSVPSMSFLEGLFGEEFPEAFGGSPAKSRKTILNLPAELLAIVCDQVSGVDIKQLRLASKILADKVDLRIDRVYISPNRANLDYLQRILSHRRYKARVYELVWDTAQLSEYSTFNSFRDAILSDERETRRAIEDRLVQAIETYANESPEYRSLEHRDLFQDDGRLTAVAKEIVMRYDDDFSRDMLARNAMMMSIEDSYALYQNLYQDEQDIMKQQLDVTALHQALDSFPKLRRVTVTSEVWRPWHRVPRYTTPFYRSLPPGFRKPTVWPWLMPPSHPATDAEILSCKDRLAADWRGYERVVSAILAMSNPTIEEFIVDAGDEGWGIPYQLFCDDLKNFDDTIRMFQHAPLKRLQLVLSFPDPYIGLISKMIPGLTPALAQMQHLEHLDLNLNIMRTIRATPVTSNHSIRFDLLPDSLKKKLKTLALRDIFIGRNQLYDLLCTLPSIQQITLDRISPNEGPDFFALFRHLSMYYKQAGVSWPRYTIVTPLVTQEDNGHYKQLVDVEIDEFLYGTSGVSPFAEMSGKVFKEHVGWRINVRDEGVRGRMCDVIERAAVQRWGEEM
jgi:hypothetical protein